MQLADFLGIKDIDSLAKVLEIDIKHLRQVIYANDYTQNYRMFFMRKKNGGMRVIEAPKGHLRTIQQRLNTVLNEFYSSYAPEPAHGFVIGKSIATNAALHVNKQWVMNCDLENFYGSISKQRVSGLFSHAPFYLGHQVADLLATLFTTRTGLPQGAPTSSTLSNMIAYSLDHQLSHFAAKRGYQYSRYADDITFSSNRRFSADVVVKELVFDFQLDTYLETKNYVVGDKLNDIIEACNFRVNPSKTRLQSRYERQVVTGLRVNEKVNVDRKYIRNLRAMIHAAKTYGVEAEKLFREKYAKKRYETDPHGALRLNKTNFMNTLIGKLAFVKMVKGENDPVYLKLLASIQGDAWLYGASKEVDTRLRYQLIALKRYGNFSRIEPKRY